MLVRKDKKQTRLQRGVSFLEIMIVVVIMASIAALAAPALFKQLDNSKVKNTKNNIIRLRAILGNYRLHSGRYPTTAQGLESLIRKPTVGESKSWNGPYLTSKKTPKDDWQRDFIYRSDGKEYVLISLGADGEEGGDGFDTDISSEKL